MSCLMMVELYAYYEYLFKHNLAQQFNLQLVNFAYFHCISCCLLSFSQTIAPFFGADHSLSLPPD